jgi:hypothetical protein
MSTYCFTSFNYLNVKDMVKMSRQSYRWYYIIHQYQLPRGLPRSTKIVRNIGAVATENRLPPLNLHRRKCTIGLFQNFKVLRN